MSDPRLLAVLLNFRTPDMCKRAAETAVAALDGLNGELVIVDNDSGDGSYEILRDYVRAQDWPHVRVVASGHNGGFGAGNNVGIHAGLSNGSAPDFVYILNSDAFPEPDAIRVLRDWLIAHPMAGIAGSRIYGEDGAPHVTTFRFPSVAGEFEHAIRFGPVSRALRNSRVPMEIPDHAMPVNWLAGASMMMRREMLDRIGVFDETFFLYFEETDLCLRAARDGWDTWYLPQSRVMHIGSVSTGMRKWDRIPQYWLDSRLYYFMKNHGRLYAALATLAHVGGGVLWRLRRVIQRKPHADPPHFLGDLLKHDVCAAFGRRPTKGATPAPRSDQQGDCHDPL
ncbi:glycosyltransferase family 2 protein [Phaeobacter sp. J2-8]|uniref:glycosyltransferase family 2 protein n=1 Tax=Phaeobacter sp. J2-8 TaxID=2931394 RepID=UPI001FD14E92|nr:glycosyltransferase family 2 protein [Phaeobacter sp. J2-8]MCJ7874262.1 glycosyltransferase family 2 protein [Phaeobacter sp. J2-8]